MKFKANKIILFCNRRLTQQISSNWANSEYVKNLLLLVQKQSENEELGSLDFETMINYLLYTLGNYYRGNTIFVFQLLVAFLYLITPVDIISDFIPGIGYLDDILLFNMILSSYQNELNLFSSKVSEKLDIKYMRVDPRIIEEFDIEPKDVMDLVIKDRKLEEVDGEALINQMVADATGYSADDFVRFDSNDIIEYELINYLLKAKSNQVTLTDELIVDLVQIPNTVTTKDANYFLKNIEELMPNSITDVNKEKRNMFSSSQYIIEFEADKLLTSPMIHFVQTAASFTKERVAYIKYEASTDAKIEYEHIVEIIDILNQKHLFAATFFEFKIILEEAEVTFNVDLERKDVSYEVSNQAVICLNDQMATIASVISGRI